jgi:hypothetical protein
VEAQTNTALEDQEGNEKAKENKTPDTATKTPAKMPGQRRLVGLRHRFPNVIF